MLTHCGGESQLLKWWQIFGQFMLFKDYQRQFKVCLIFTLTSYYKGYQSPNFYGAQESIQGDRFCQPM
jgi:hypothetical protein